ncbi:phage terminase small subunit [Lysinibacillus sp. NPDC093216]|uniref:phage terminase small subunit n=1 Tax=Lysinibacillus sp. NPDC093216 TaxID=3390576 RepID=UPI003CFCDADE
MTNWDAIRKEWETSRITLIELAEKHGVKEGTLKSRKSREGWKKVATKKDASEKKKMQPPKKDATSKGPRKRSGNPNPKNQFSSRNNPKLDHGLFAKYLPDETQEIIEAMNAKSAADLMWDQITIQYAAILRAQKIMHVESKDEMIKELKREKMQGGKNPSQEVEYEFQFAWERQAQLLTAQSRAISELRTSINHFIKLADEADERRLKLEQMQLSNDKTKVEIDKLGSDEQNGPIEIKIVGKKRS